MALKKPSDFFGNTKKTPLDEVKEEYVAASPEKIEQVSEAFDAFKANLNHIQSLSDFTSTFDSFKENLEKVENVSSEVNTIKDELKSLLKQEDLDSAMMAQLLFVDESISKIESKILSINGKTVDQIKEDFKDLSTSVEGFLNIDVPKYKKLISESEVRVDDRFGQFKDKVEENLNTIREDVSKEVTSSLSEVEKLNTDAISEVKEDFRKNTKEVKNLVEKELPKYKKFFTETELKTEETIKNAIDSYKETIENLNAKVKVFTETEIPKYNNLLIETKLKSEQEVKQLEEEVLSKVNSLSEKVDFLSGDVTEKTAEKIQELQTVIDEYKEEIDSISKTYNNLYKDFKKREISDNEKLEGYSNEIEKYNKRFAFLEETVTEDLREIQSVLIRSNETYHTSLKAEVGKFRSKISEQMEGLQMDLVVNEQHIKKQNENIESVKEEIQEVLKRLQLDTLEEKNKELVEKIAYLEETISEINEKKLLVEDNPTLPGDPSTNNSADPLTPLDQKFVTFDQLQNHYRTFINRIQQQIATIGGGGAGFIKDLDDVTFDAGIGTGKLLIYNGAKWVGIASTAVGGGDASTLAENTIGTNLVLSGNLTVAGIATYEDVRNIDSIGIVTARDGIRIGTGGTVGPVGSGIVTYFGDGSQLTGIIAGVGIQSGSVRVGTGFTDIKFTGATVTGSGTTVTVDIPSSTITRQTETSSGVTTDFTITGGYTVGLIDVYLNGVKQRSGVDFTATDGSTVTMTPFISDGDVVEFQKFDVSVSGSGGSGITTANIVSDSLVVSGVSTFSGNVNLDGDITSNVTITSTDTGSSAAPELALYRNSASPAPGDYLGQLMFKGENSNGGQENYAKITGKITDETLGTEDGLIETAIKGGGSFTIVSRQRSDELQLLNGVGLSVDGDSTFTGGIDVSGAATFQGGLVEKFQTGTTLAADNTLALSDGNVIRRTDNESGNQTVNFTGVHSTLSNGEVVSFTVIITPNGSGVINAVQIDGQAITVSWSGGSAPSAGSSGKDVYTFSVFKTGTGVSDYEVYGAATNYA